MLGAAYLLLAGVAAWQTVAYTNSANATLDLIGEKKSLSNHSSQALAKFVAGHRIIGSYVAGDLQRDFKLPSFKASAEGLAQVPALSRSAEEEERLASLWSCLLLGLSAAYLALAVFHPKMDPARSLLLAGTGVSLLFFLVGISACALRIFTVITNFFGTSPVLQHQVRSISSVIVELLTKGHWFFGGAILLFSVLTPVVKSVLTYVAALQAPPARRERIEKLLKAVGKWSMADVFVAAILLACYSLKSGKGTQVIPCLGLYYFAGYCLLSMLCTSLLARIGPEKGGRPGPLGKFGAPVLMAAAAGLFLAAIHGL